jgi:hypothetical protein
MKWSLPVVLLGVWGALAACGSATNEEGRFRFTPVPYTFIDGYMGTRVPVSLPTNVTADRCYPYVADEVMVDVARDKVSGLKDWLSSVGFSVIEQEDRLPDPQPVSLLVRVPVGSVPDAAGAIQRRPGVVAAEHNSLGKYPESPNLPVCPTPAPLPRIADALLATPTSDLRPPTP